MISLNRDTLSIAVAVLVVAVCYYLYTEVNANKSDIERCKSFSIELANKVIPPQMVPHPPAPQTERVEQEQEERIIEEE